MLVDKKIVIPLTSRLFADEVSRLQELIGCVVNVKDPHKLQSIQSLGLSPACSPDGTIDFVKMVGYLSSCALAILEEVSPDELTLTRIDPLENYSIKNVYTPHFHWDSHCNLTIIPPVLETEMRRITLESNGCVLMFPLVVPRQLAQDILHKMLLHTIYARVATYDPAVNLGVVRAHTEAVSYLGREYRLDFGDQTTSTLGVLDNLAIYTSILTALIPRACNRLMQSLMRFDEHELMDIFRGMVPADLVQEDEVGDVEEDIVRMNAFMTYMQSLGTVFNLGPTLHTTTYCAETKVATCWCPYY